MIQIKRFINELMTSNCYLVVDEKAKRCVVIDPGSEKSEREISFIQEHQLILDYVLVTHEHSDHNWGVNVLMEVLSEAKLICSEECASRVNKQYKAYFLLYYNDPNYRYDLRQPDILIKTDDDTLEWNGHKMEFLLTPGHSYGSMCIKLDDVIFTGDTIMPFKPYFNGRDSNQIEWAKSLEKVSRLQVTDLMIYPGHGEPLTYGNWKNSEMSRI